MSDPASKRLSPEEWIANELAQRRRTFEEGDYDGFMWALLYCCSNDLPLPEWVSKVVIQQAEDVFEHGSTGPGKHGNWRKTWQAKQIDAARARLATHHLQARQRRGRVQVSELAAFYGYGKPTPGGGPHIVTREDIFEFIFKYLSKTPSRGSRDAIEDSYKRVKRLKARRGCE